MKTARINLLFVPGGRRTNGRRRRRPVLTEAQFAQFLKALAAPRPVPMRH
jgi:hypothetical protein